MVEYSPPRLFPKNLDLLEGINNYLKNLQKELQLFLTSIFELKPMCII